MHIVIDCRCIHRHMGGIGRAAMGLCEALGKLPRGHRLTVLLGADPPAELQLDGVEVVCVDAGMIDERFEQLGLPNVLLDMSADIYVNTSFSVPALKTTQFQVAFIHDVVFEERPDWVDPGLGEYLRRWSRFSSLHADRIITVSDHAKGRIQEVYGTSPERVARIYNGIPADAFTPATPESLRDTLVKFQIQEPYLLYVGSIEPKKGVPQLLDAFEVMTKKGCRSQLVLAGGQGGGGANYKIQEHLSRLACAQYVKLLGYVSDEEKKALLTGCDLFVYPSLYEGFGLPPMEALALGKPTLVHAGTSLPEVTGRFSLKTDANDLSSFVTALNQGLCDELYRQEAKIGGPSWTKNFNWPAAAERLLTLCEELMVA